jgi:hypothetical protein
MREDVACLYTLERTKAYLRNPVRVHNCTDIRFENMYAATLCR